jgi:BASS family bile acid:Na+ symporter
MLQILLGVAIFAILFSIGIGLSVADFRRLLARPRAFLLALACQLLLLPALAVAIAWLFGLDGVAGFGLLLLAVCPGGVTSALFTRLAGGHTALSVSLTAVNSLLAVVSIPAILYVGQRLLGSQAQVVTIPFDYLLQQLLVITFLPVVLGMLVKHVAPRRSLPLERVLFPLTSLLFFFLIVYLWYTEFDTYRQAFIAAAAPTVTLFLSVCTVSLLVARRARISRGDRIATVFEVGVQNPPVAFFIAVNILQDMALVPPSAVYAVVMVVASVVLVPAIRRFPSLVG